MHTLARTLDVASPVPLVVGGIFLLLFVLVVIAGIVVAVVFIVRAVVRRGEAQNTPPAYPQQSHTAQPSCPPAAPPEGESQEPAARDENGDAP